MPEHTVETGAYFISRNETTYQEYLDYLESLSLDERRARTPRIETGFHGALTLEEVAPGRWQLTMQPNDVAYRALAGQALEYQARDRRTRQDWLRFPVAGVTADDARAYAAWVDRTDRIPGARLCTEHEWERAARGADDRLYPHGDRLAPDDANFDETYGKRPAAFGPDEIGSHPASNSPFGVADLAGNVWEWTTSSIGPTGVAARGGSYFFARLVATSVNRQLPAPDFRDLTLGIRLCANVRP